MTSTRMCEWMCTQTERRSIVYLITSICHSLWPDSHYTTFIVLVISDLKGIVLFDHLNWQAT